MSDILFLPDDLSGPWHTTEATLLGPADKRGLAGREMVVILSGQSVRTLDHELPSLRTKEREQAARFHIEPMVGEDVDRLHIVVGDAKLAVVARSRMDAVMDALAEAGVVPSAIYADHDVLPPATLPDRIILEGATVDHGFPVADVPPKRGLAEITPLARFDAGLDLLTGPYAKRRLPSFADNSGWMKVAASLLVAVGASWFALQGAEARAERLQISDLRQRASQAYIDATGTASTNPARDVAQFTAEPEAVGALDLMGVLFAGLSEVDGVSVEELSYNGDGALDLRLSYPGFGVTDAVEAAVNRAGGTLRAGGVRESGGRFFGEATLSVEGR